MAKLELPVRAFIEDFVKRAFPDRNWDRGSGINDLVVKPMAVLLQPLRHEIDAIKVGQSITNYQYMRRADLDGLAANWGKFRQRGSRSIGPVRIYFDTAAEYRFTFLEFFAQDGTTFVLSSPVAISVTDLLSRRRSDGSFYFDVTVQSLGVGNRYALPAGSIVGIRNAPTGIIRVENLEDFQVTAPDESNFDVVNSIFKNVGMRNLVSRASIRAPLYDNFAGIVDIFIAGADHAKMVRDLATVEIDGRDVLLHLGGMTDIWINTTSVVPRQVTLSYLPSTGKFKLVSATQAQENELLYTFSQSFLSLDGLFSAPDFPLVELDESSGIFFDVAGITEKTFVLGPAVNDRYQLATKDLVGGNQMLPLPAKGNDTSYLTDPLGVNFLNTDLKVGDFIQYQDKPLKITAKSGRVIEVSPANTLRTQIQFDDSDGLFVVDAGDRFIPFEVAVTAYINDEVVIPHDACAGSYRLLSIAGNGFYIGNVVSRGELVFISQDVPNGTYTYQYNQVGGGTPHIPFDLTNKAWVYFGDDGAFDQTANLWFKIESLTRDINNAVFITTTGGSLTPPAVVHLVEGLRDRLLNGGKIYFHTPSGASFPRVTRGIFGDNSLTPGDNVCHTLYFNVVETAIPSGTNEIASLGLGSAATVGDMLMFEGGFLPVSEIAKTGGDGTKFTVMVDSIVDQDTVQYRPLLSFEIPVGTRFVLQRNHTPVGNLTAGLIDYIINTVDIPAWPIGLGDGTGLFLKDTLNNTYAITRSTAGNIRELKFNPPQQAITLTFQAAGYLGVSPDDVGLPVVQTVGPNSYAGLLHDYDNSLRQWIVIPNNVSVDTFAVSPGNPVSVVDGQGTGIVSALSAPFQVGYFDPISVTILSSLNISSADALLKRFSFSGAPNLVTVMPGHLLVVSGGLNAGKTFTILTVDNTFKRVTVVETVLTTGAGATANVVQSDAGKIVRQGTYTGILDSFIGAPATVGGPQYIWRIKPLSDFDRFDITDTTTFVDYGSGSPSIGLGRGTLREPASIPQVSIASVTVSLDRSPLFLVGEALTIFSRFGYTGGFFDGKFFKVLKDSAVNDDPFAAAAKETDNLLVLLGTNLDTYTLDGVSRYALSTLQARAPDIIRIANAPRLQPLPFTTKIDANTVALALPGSNLGLWALHGRVLVIRANETVYYLAIDGPNGLDGLNLIDALPVTLYPDQAVEYEIVEGFHSPYQVLPEASYAEYRTFRVPDLGDVILQGTKGFHGASAVFQDATMNFYSLLGAADFASEDYLLYIDDGPSASTMPIVIVGLADSVTLQLATAITAVASGLTYHIVVRNRAKNREFWLRGEILNATQIELDVPNGWDFQRNDTPFEWVFVVLPHPEGNGTWKVPILTGTYNPGTKIVTFNPAAIALTNPPGALFTPGTGFTAPLFNEPVRIMPRLVDRAALHSLDGSAATTYNYYAEDFFTLPLVRIQNVQLLNPQTLQPVRDIAYRLNVRDPGLRYSHRETNEIEILAPDLVDAVLQPVRVSYISDLSVEAIDKYLNADDTRVLNANQVAKRMETISVDISIRVRSEETEAIVGEKVSAFINTNKSTEPLSKDKLIRFLYQENVVSYIEVATIILSATYYQLDGTNIVYSDADTIFGSDTACYLARSVTVAKLAEQISG